jgi:CRP-like cAMP-binding protein
MAQALTQVDLVTFEDDDFLAAQDSSIKMSMEQRLVFLSNVAPFKHWEKYRLHRIAHALDQAEFEIGHQILTHGTASKCLYFLLGGRVDVVPSPHQMNSPIATLQKYECFGEAGFINSRNRVVKKVSEVFCTVCVTRVDVLMLPAAKFNLIEEHTADMIYAAFTSKVAWRQRRYQEVRLERKQIRLLRNSIAEAKRQLKLQQPLISMSASSDIALSSSLSMVSSPLASKSLAVPGTLSSPSLASPSWVSTTRNQPLRPLSPGAASTSMSVASLDQLNMNESNVFAEPLVKSVHTISLAEASRGAFTPSLNDRLEDIEDIPIILDRDFDPFMIIHSCRSDKDKVKMQHQMTNLRRPKIARTKARSANDHQDGGFRARLAALRPVTSYGIGRVSESNAFLLPTPRNATNAPLPAAIDGNLILHAPTATSGDVVPAAGTQVLESDEDEDALMRRRRSHTSTAEGSMLFGSGRIPNSQSYAEMMRRRSSAFSSQA